MGSSWLKRAESLWQHTGQFGEMGFKLKDLRSGVQRAATVPLLPPGEQVIATSAETDFHWLPLEWRIKAQHTLCVLMAMVNSLAAFLGNPILRLSLKCLYANRCRMGNKLEIHVHSRGHDVTAMLRHGGIAYMTGILSWMGMSFLERAEKCQRSKVECLLM